MSLRSEVLKAFRLLHRTKNKVFKNDNEVINLIRQEINDSFRKHKEENDPEKIKELLKEAYLVEEDLRTKIIQLEEVAPGYHKAKITEDHCMAEPRKPRLEKKNTKK